jgi:hypothetical protein
MDPCWQQQPKYDTIQLLLFETSRNGSIIDGTGLVILKNWSATDEPLQHDQQNTVEVEYSCLYMFYLLLRRRCEVASDKIIDVRRHYCSRRLHKPMFFGNLVLARHMYVCFVCYYACQLCVCTFWQLLPVPSCSAVPIRLWPKHMGYHTAMQSITDANNCLISKDESLMPEVLVG